MLHNGNPLAHQRHHFIDGPLAGERPRFRDFGTWTGPAVRLPGTESAGVAYPEFTKSYACLWRVRGPEKNVTYQTEGEFIEIDGVQALVWHVCDEQR